jgi:hypothetical protein
MCPEIVEKVGRYAQFYEKTYKVPCGRRVGLDSSPKRKKPKDRDSDTGYKVLESNEVPCLS